MRGLKITLIVCMGLCLLAGFILTCFAGVLAGVKKNKEGATRKELRLKIIGYVVFLAAFAFAVFQSLISF